MSRFTDDGTPDDATRPCEACGKLMILEYTGWVMPLGQLGELRCREWWCACGHAAEASPRKVEFTDPRHAKWEAAQCKGEDANP